MVVPPAPPPMPAPKRTSPWLFVGIGCGVLLLCGLGVGGLVMLVFKATDAPFDATHAFFNKIGAGDLSGAYADTTPGFQSDVPREKFDTYFGGLNFDDVTIHNRNVQNQTARMEGTVKVAGGATYDFGIDLKQSGDRWLIHQVEGGFGTYLLSR